MAPKPGAATNDPSAASKAEWAVKRLGPALVRLAAAASVDFDQITRPVMAHLSRQIGETVDLFFDSSPVFKITAPGQAIVFDVPGVIPQPDRRL